MAESNNAHVQWLSALPDCIVWVQDAAGQLGGSLSRSANSRSPAAKNESLYI